MRKGRRRRRASLRGWWRALPFTVGAGALFFVFAWLHTQLLRNEYRSIELTAEIQRVKGRIAELRGERFALGSMESMKRKHELAFKDALLEPRPGQVQIVRPTIEDLSTMAAAVHSTAKPERTTRSVVVILRKADDPPAEIVTPDTAMAQRNEAQAGTESGKL